MNNIKTCIPEAYIVQNKNESVRLQSTSGGFFSLLAEYVIGNGGIVYGAAYNDNFEVEHIGIEKVDELYRLRESKYVQSKIKNCFYEIKKKIENGVLVCFSGTPCQINGLYSFLGQDYTNLITVGVVCYGVPSPKLFRLYVDFLQNKYKDKLVNFHFRSKKYGYSSPTVVAEFEKKGAVDSKSAIKSFTKAYFNGVSIRPSCYTCSSKTEEKKIDFLMGDCWNVSKYKRDLDDNLGTTSLFVYTDKGKQLLNKLNDFCLVQKVDEKELLNSDCIMIIKTKPYNPKRELLFKNIDSMEYETLINYVIPDTISNKLANIVKPIIYKMGIKNSMLLKVVKKYRVQKNSKK